MKTCVTNVLKHPVLLDYYGDVLGAEQALMLDEEIATVRQNLRRQSAYLHLSQVPEAVDAEIVAAVVAAVVEATREAPEPEPELVRVDLNASDAAEAHEAVEEPPAIASEREAVAAEHAEEEELTVDEEEK